MKPKTLFTVVEGGERTYIHPYSYDQTTWCSQNNKLRFLFTPEFAVDQENTETDFMYDYYCTKFRKCVDIVRRLSTLLRIWLKHFRKVRYIPYLWRTIQPVYCTDLFTEHTISVPGTLVVSSPATALTDTVYLIPSQKWIRQKLEEWRHRKDHKALNAYETWEREQLSLGRTIAFLSSLDT